MEEAIHRLVDSIAAAHGTAASVRYERRYPPTINDFGATRQATVAAASVVGDENVELDPQPSMGAEDFAFMLNEKPGCYIWIGNGSREGGCTLHNPTYDFNDAILTLGASYWAHLAETQLA